MKMLPLQLELLEQVQTTDYTDGSGVINDMTISAETHQPQQTLPTDDVAKEMKQQ